LVLPLTGLPVWRGLLTIGRGLLLSVGRLLLTISRRLLLPVLAVLPLLRRLLLLPVLPLRLLPVAASVPARRLLRVSSTRCSRFAHETTDHACGGVGLGELRCEAHGLKSVVSVEMEMKERWT
jgi:hypothetical protein